MSSSTSIVADGRERLLLGTARARQQRYAELLGELAHQHHGSSQGAGFFQRMALRYRIRKEARATVQREFGLPSPHALFFSAL